MGFIKDVSEGLLEDVGEGLIELSCKEVRAGGFAFGDVFDGSADLRKFDSAFHFLGEL